MVEELLAHFRALSHLLTENGTTNPTEHIRKFENATLLHRYTDGIKCYIFLSTLIDFGQQWFDQLSAGSIRSFAEFSSLFLYQFASSEKCKKSAFSLFEVKQEEKEILRAYIEHFNKIILEVPTTHFEVLISARGFARNSF
ncbi:UNVERIFIED_CONTAM: hypothetical protein Slati_0474600 [Sesamum latifolium]|uniref:Retrotransposon gag domain-containing protein n=1 Tax=Sesamum latifolium TaxID=2727402 RepID=A0AAW2XZ84_9LAMI